MDRQTVRRERTGILHIVAITAVLAFALWGGAQLLGSTRATWERQHAAARPEETTAARNANADLQRAYREAKARGITDAREHYEAEVAAGRIRCLNGQVFRRLENGWENVPGQACR